MMLTAARMRQIGWGALLACCILVFTILSLTVHAVQNEVILAERRILALKQETLMLETEFESRANQRQLANWNRVEFGYEAPRADQYLDDRRQLAALGKPAGPGAPRPIRIARSEPGAHTGEGAREMVSPISGARITRASAPDERDALGGFSEAFEGFLLERSKPGESAPGGGGQAARAQRQILSGAALAGASQSGAGQSGAGTQ